MEYSRTKVEQITNDSQIVEDYGEILSPKEITNILKKLFPSCEERKGLLYGEYKGKYHVLSGLLRPLEGIGPAQLSIQPLLNRIKEGIVTEIIIATNPTVEGDTTALYLNKMITELNMPQPPKVTRLATGIPVGGDLEYIDKRTLALSFRGRSTL